MKRVLYVGYIMWSRVWLPRYWVSRDATVSRYWPCFVVSFCRSCLKHSCQEKTQLGDIMFSDPSVCPLSVRPSVRHPSIIVYFAWRSISLLSETCDTYSPCEWTLLKSFSGSEVKGQGDLDLWLLDLTPFYLHFGCHVFKLCTKFKRNRIIRRWVIDDSARFRRAILGGGQQNWQRVLRSVWTQLHQTWRGHRRIIAALHFCFRSSSDILLHFQTRVAQS